MFMWDEAEYASLGRSLIDDNSYTINQQPHALRPPVLPIINALSFSIFGIGDTSAKIPIFLLALLSLCAIYLVMLKEFSEKIAIASSFFLGTIPLYLKHLGNNLAEIPFTFFYICSIFMFYYALNNNKKYFYPAWIFFGAALMTRYNGLLIPLSVAIYGGLMFAASGNKKKYLQDLFSSKHFFMAPVIAFLIISPWYLYQYVAFGTPFKGLIMSSGQLASWATVVGSASNYIYISWLPNLVSLPIFLLSLIGIAYMLAKRNSFLSYLMVNLLVVFLYFSLQPSKDPRFMAQLMPFFAIFAAVGLFKVLYPWLCRDINKKIVFMFLILGVSYVGFVNYSTAEANYELSSAIGYPSLIQASSYVNSNTNANQVIVGASIPQYYWYSERVTHGYPQEEQDLFDFLSETEVSYILLNNYERNQPQYVMQLFAKGFFTDEGTLRYLEDAQELKIFGDLSKFNDPMMNPVTIVVPADLFVERTQHLLNDTI
ncbi:MAG: glycosyltransferase family 39 protein [Candidatus Aenigmarchaeota archaeon]|nr:glycosyltransferase family 39 protein [Candidatus Aenigmarchaeota archaeon]